ncbi:MAG: hypothetical protein QNJ92_16890 [Alphaproteobacteria bacterium]|nr:hypothetical protein [Alphaproteobacteria bacterium]
MVALAAALLSGAAGAAEPTFPPGSHIGLAPPSGFVISSDFTGFMDREVGSSIVINTLPAAAYAELTAGFTAERLAGQGMTLLGPCAAVKTAAEHSCLRVSQQARGIPFFKWLMTAKLGHLAALIVVTIPEAVVTGGKYPATAVEAALSSVAYTKVLATNPIDTLPFTIEEGALLPFQRTLGGSTAAFAGKDAGSGPRPLWIVAASLGADTRARSTEFGRAAFAQIAAVQEAQVTNEWPAEVGPLSGYVLEGGGRDADTGGALYVFQAILLDASDTYYRLVGLAPAAQMEVYRPEFWRLMQTLKAR